MNYDCHNFLHDQEMSKIIITNDNLTQLPIEIVNVFNHILHLDLSFNKIDNLNWLNSFIKLETLILDNNSISTMVLDDFHQISKQSNKRLQTLSLNNNKLTDFNSVIIILSDLFPNLEYLSLHGNTICPDGLTENEDELLTYEFYRDAIAESFSNLKFLDHKKICRKPLPSYVDYEMRVLKFSPKMILAKLNFKSDKMYPPLRKSYRKPGNHSGSCTIAQYQYVGKNSEGNRFIFNSDL